MRSRSEIMARFDTDYVSEFGEFMKAYLDSIRKSWPTSIAAAPSGGTSPPISSRWKRRRRTACRWSTATTTSAIRERGRLALVPRGRHAAQGLRGARLGSFCRGLGGRLRSGLRRFLRGRSDLLEQRRCPGRVLVTG